MINSFGRNPSFSKYIPQKITPLSSEKINKNLKQINNLREEIMHNPADLGLAEELRFKSDMYDIRILAELSGFNEPYFKKAKSDWRDLNKDNNARNKILRATFPKFIDNLS